MKPQALPMVAATLLLAVLSRADVQKPYGKPLDTGSDPRLAKLITLQADLRPVSEIFATLRLNTGLDVSADKSISINRMYVYVKRVPVVSLLNHIAGLHRWEWVRAGEPGNWTYRLSKPADVAEEEARQQKRWREGRQALEKARSKILSGLMQEAIEAASLPADERDALLSREPWLGRGFLDGGGRALVDALSALAPEERDALAEGSLSDAGTISSTNQTFMLRNMNGGQPFTNFSAEQRSALTQYARAAGAKTDVGGANVGFYSANGSLGLAVYCGDEVWLGETSLRAPDSPELYDATKRANNAILDGQDAAMPDANSLEHQRLLMSKYAQDNDVPHYDDLTVPRTYDQKRVSFDNIQKRNRIGSFLASIHKQTGIPIVADGLLHSSLIVTEGTLRSQLPYSLHNACAELCVRFRRKIREESGWMEIRSRKYAIYLLYEPPHDLVEKWIKLKKDQGTLSFEDLAGMSLSLSPEQILTLREVQTEDGSLQEEMSTLERNRSLFALWNGLTPDQRKHVEAGSITLDKLTKELRMEFWRACIRAQPCAVSAQPKRAGFALASNALKTTFTFFIPSSACKSREMSLPVTRDRFLK